MCVISCYTSASSSYPVSIWFFPRHRRWPDTPHSFRNRSHTFSPSRSICCFLDSKPTFSTLSSTCLLHVIFGRPCFRFPFTSSIIAFFSVLLSQVGLITCPYLLTPFAFAYLSYVSFKPRTVERDFWYRARSCENAARKKFERGYS